MKQILVCLIWTTILCASGGQLNGDPAPGRSPGPPPLRSMPQPLNRNSTATVHNRLKDNEILSDAQYMDTTDITLNDNQHTAIPKIDSKLDDSLNIIKAKNIDVNANEVIDSDDTVDYDGLNGDASSTDNRRACRVANARQDYLDRARDGRTTAVRHPYDRNVTTHSPSGTSSLPAAVTASSVIKPAATTSNIRFDVTHDMFDIAHGLVNNVVYSGKSSSFTIYVRIYLYV